MGGAGCGFPLFLKVIVAGLILAAGLGSIFSLTGASMGTQTEGANRIVAAWLADGLLGMVMTEGPAQYARRNADEGVFDAPFSDYEYEIRILDQGERDPFQVTATVRWGPGPTDLVRVQTFVATRRDPLWLETYIDFWDELEEPREPFLEVDREDRWYGSDDDEDGSGTGETGTTPGGAG